MLRAAGLALTVLTGFSGLVYEVTWQKYVATLLGSHSEATAAILGIFLAGLSVGYSLFGRLTARIVEDARRREKPPRLFLFYALIEGSIGVYALAFPWLFDAVRAISFAIPHTAAGFGFAFDVGLVALLVGPPTVLMGGTIPILTQALSTSLGDATRFHALVYGFNTIGAFAGALVGSFFLIPGIGLHGTMFAMAAVNLGAAGLFGLFERSRRRPVSAEVSALDTPDASVFAVLALVGLLTGFGMMVVQNVSIRLGGLVLGSSEYTFATIVSVFVLCIALGSLLVSLAPRIPRWVLLLNQVALLGYTSILYFAVESLPAWALFLRSRFGTEPSDFIPFHVSTFLAIFVLLGPTAILAGATLPLLFHALRRDYGDVGHVAGALYSWNALGSFLGALLGGYGLLFFVDLDRVFQVALFSLALGAGLVAWQTLPRGKLSWVALATAVVGLGIAVLPAWDSRVLTLGLFRQRAGDFERMSDVHTAVALRLDSQLDRLVFHEDDPVASVSVRERNHPDGVVSRALMTNGKGDGETRADYPTMALAGLIPAILAEKVERAFVIGYGTGVTVGELASLETIQEVRVAEISPGVARAAPLFDFANLGASTHPKAKIVQSDAYRALMRSEGGYDVIVSEPSNPWTTGVEMLFSREFLQAARDRLSPGGVYVQWYHQYETDDEAVKLVLRTYSAVFDRVAVWYGLGADLLLLGMQDADFEPDLARALRRMARADIGAGLQRSGIDSPASLFAHELVPVGVIGLDDTPGPIHTLIQPRLNHVAGRAFFRGGAGSLPALRSGREAAVGVRNSTLRRYVEGLAPVQAEEARRSATLEACRYRRTQCITFVVDLLSRNPDLSELTPLLDQVYGPSPRARVGGAVSPEMTASLMRIAAPGFVAGLRLVRPEVAEHATHLYRRFYQYATPFDPRILVEFWRKCRAPVGSDGVCESGLRQAQALAPNGLESNKSQSGAD